MNQLLDDKIEEINQYFHQNNIPHFRVRGQPQKHLTKFLFPGGYLTFISKSIINSSRESTDKFYNNLDANLRDVEENVKIYLLVYNLENQDRKNQKFKELEEEFDQEFGFDSFGGGIELITNINQITVTDYQYVIEMPHILRALKVNPISDIFKDKKLICDDYAYQRFLAVSQDEDIEMLKSKYQIEILETEELNQKYPFRLALSFKKTTQPNQNRFIHCLEGELKNIETIEKPNKVIYGVSHLCNQCNGYFFIRKDEDPEQRDTCLKCLRMINKQGEKTKEEEKIKEDEK